MNLIEMRKNLARRYTYVERPFIVGGTFVYCNEEVPKLDKNGKRTGRYEPCGHKRRSIARILHHASRTH